VYYTRQCTHAAPTALYRCSPYESWKRYRRSPERCPHLRCQPPASHHMAIDALPTRTKSSTCTTCDAEADGSIDRARSSRRLSRRHTQATVPRTLVWLDPMQLTRVWIPLQVAQCSTAVAKPQPSPWGVVPLRPSRSWSWTWHGIFFSVATAPCARPDKEGGREGGARGAARSLTTPTRPLLQTLMSLTPGFQCVHPRTLMPKLPASFSSPQDTLLLFPVLSIQPSIPMAT
jgi:hypothetical protein